jgi:hypothetical protein
MIINKKAQGKAIISISGNRNEFSDYDRVEKALEVIIGMTAKN